MKLSLSSPSARHAFLFAVFAGATLLAAPEPGRVADAEARVTFANSLVPLPVVASGAAKTAAMVAGHIVATDVAPVTAAQLTAPLEFNVAMQMRDFAEFQHRVASGETVPFEEMEKKYFPLQSDYDATRKWLVGEGFSVQKDDARRLGIFASGTVAQVSASFRVTMQSVTVDSVAYVAASTAPSLPASAAKGVLGINGLQPYLKLHRHLVKIPFGPTAQTNGSPPYMINDVRKAYDSATLAVSNGTSTTTLTGNGQKIAIIIDTYPQNTDLTTFWTNNGITSQSLSNIEEVNVPGGTLDALGEEETLDVEWSSGIAPKAKVRIYASDDLSFVNIEKCMSQVATDVTGATAAAVAQPQLHVLSMSLGLGETYLVGYSDFTTESQYFTTIANGSTFYGGVSVFVSSGDAGSTPDQTGHATGGPLQAEYESTDPNVTGVGGTNLYLDVNSNRTSESAWADSGGGTSIEFARPAWQVGTGVPTSSTPLMRLAPDVALVGSSSTYAYLWYKGAYTGVAGTSWSAPSWAGFAALINEGRTVQSRLPLGLLNPRIYPLIGTNNFFDITSGSNAVGANANGNYPATVGYDEVTGIGTPDVAKLLNTLLGPVITSFSPVSGIGGTSVVITGANFYNVTSVKFNGGAAASYTVNSPTQITATTPTGVTTGPIAVTALGDLTTSSTNFTGLVSDLTITKTHTGNFTQADPADTYTIIVTNSGTGPTSGLVTVTDTLPAGLTATALSGTGWVAAGNHLSATRTDALAAGSSYPTLTLTVSVSSTVGTSRINTAGVSGGGEINTSNDTVSDQTTITALTPSQSWRYQYFGTTANTGNAADTANPSGDGLPNLVKYALGLDPTKPALNTVTADTSTGYLRLTVPKNTNATDITYTVQVSGDLTNASSWTTTGTTVITNTSSSLQVQDNTPYPPASGTAKRFIRLLISR